LNGWAIRLFLWDALEGIDLYMQTVGDSDMWGFGV